MKIEEKLMKIQVAIKAPKNLYNRFGKYYYRNAESICEAVKPYLAEQKVCLILHDDILQMGDRFYVKATAELRDTESSDVISVSALAREALDKKGMDDSQITGTASSYARKYALNGLFLLDDTKDADTDENRMERENRQEEKTTISKTEAKTLYAMIQNRGIDINDFLKEKGIQKLSDLSPERYVQVLKELKELGGEKVAV